MHGHSSGASKVSRRTFFLGGAAVLAMSSCATRPEYKMPQLARKPYQRKSFTGKCTPVEKPQFALPGRFPGRVVEVHHENAVQFGMIQAEPVKSMLDRGMMELTGAEAPIDAWRSFFAKDDSVAIKVNPVGFSRDPKRKSSISNFATIDAIIRNLREVGVREICLYDRYARDFLGAGYDTYLQREHPDLRWYVSAWEYNDTQVALDGLDISPRESIPATLRDRILGYDEDVFRKLDYKANAAHASDRLSFESHQSRIVTGGRVSKIICIPVLKDHRTGGITMALKNLSHGFVNNVSRSHNGGQGWGDNTNGSFIPQMVSLKPIAQLAVLQIADALVGCYEGGPGVWNRTWSTWEQKSLFFATDPVAMDHVGWDILDWVRSQRGWAPVGEMGLHGNNRAGAEAFTRRQPEHVEISGRTSVTEDGKNPVGIFDPSKIEYRRVDLSAKS